MYSKYEVCIRYVYVYMRVHSERRQSVVPNKVLVTGHIGIYTQFIYTYI